MYKTIHGITPMYMTDNIVMAGETHDRNTRLSDSNDVNIPPHNSDVPKRSFIYNGSVIWNNLPDEIRMATDVADFKWRYKCLILNPLFENGWCPFACKLTENCVYFICHFIPCLKLVYLHVCLLSYLWFYCIRYQIKWNCVTGQHGRTVVLLNAITLYKYIWKKKFIIRSLVLNYQAQDIYKADITLIVLDQIY